MLIPALISLGLFFQTISPEAVQHVKAGLAAKQQGNLPQAIVEFRKVTELAPDLPAAYVNLGAALLQDHQFADAIPPLKKALTMNPSLAGADQMLGYALLSAGYTEEALPHLAKTQDVGAIGVADLKLGRFPDAIKNLNAALEQHPNDPDLLYYLGRASGLLSKSAFDTLESEFPDSARTHQSLAENYVALKRLSDAEREYDAAVRSRPDLPGLHLAMGEMYLLVPDLPKAESEFQQAAGLEPGSAEDAFRLGDALLQEGKLPQARTELVRADQLRPDMPQTLYALGKAQSLTGDTSGAEKSWESVVRVDKTSSLAAQAHFSLASLYRKQGKQTEAAREMSAYQSLKHHGPPQVK
jgi:tetratricopeptide (TPR) repeat protein